LAGILGFNELMITSFPQVFIDVVVIVLQLSVETSKKGGGRAMNTKIEELVDISRIMIC
jgi:hypothetical protein